MEFKESSKIGTFLNNINFEHLIEYLLLNCCEVLNTDDNV